MPKKLAAGIMFTDGEKVLLTRRSKLGGNAGKWDIPGGGCEPGETPRENASREAKEECGHNDGEEFSILIDRDEERVFTIFFHKVESRFDCVLSDEHDAYAWVKLDAVKDMKLHPKLKRCIDDCLYVLQSKLKFREWLVA